MKDLKETTDPITEITVGVKDVAEETDVTVTARKDEADRDSREETARRTDVPTETTEKECQGKRRSQEERLSS